MKYTVIKKEVDRVDLSAFCKVLAADITCGKIKLRHDVEKKSETF